MAGGAAGGGRSRSEAQPIPIRASVPERNVTATPVSSGLDRRRQDARASVLADRAPASATACDARTISSRSTRAFSGIPGVGLKSDTWIATASVAMLDPIRGATRGAKLHAGQAERPQGWHPAGSFLVPLPAR